METPSRRCERLLWSVVYYFFRSLTYTLSLGIDRYPHSIVSAIAIVFILLFVPFAQAAALLSVLRPLASAPGKE